MAYLAAWLRARRTVAASKAFSGIQRGVLCDIERQRYRQAIRAMGIEPGDLFRVR